jgi:hypothetical protein
VGVKVWIPGGVYGRNDEMTGFSVRRSGVEVLEAVGLAVLVTNPPPAGFLRETSGLSLLIIPDSAVAIGDWHHEESPHCAFITEI